MIMLRDYSLDQTSAVGLTPLAAIDIAADAGFRYVGLGVEQASGEAGIHDLVNQPLLMRETKARLLKTGMRVWNVGVASMDPAHDHSAYQALLEAGAALGATYVVARLPDPDRSRATERFAALCDMAEQLGLGVSLQFLAGTETPDLGEAARVLRAANRPKAGILVDAQQFHGSGSSLAELKALPREWFSWAQFGGLEESAPASGEAINPQATPVRRSASGGAIDIKKLIASLPADIVVSLRAANNAVPTQTGFREYAKRALQATKRHFDQ